MDPLLDIGSFWHSKSTREGYGQQYIKMFELRPTPLRADSKLRFSYPWETITHLLGGGTKKKISTDHSNTRCAWVKGKKEGEFGITPGEFGLLEHKVWSLYRFR